MNAWQCLLAVHAAKFGQIVDHPFNQQLLAGTLPRATFDFFVTQDQPYLVEFAKVLKAIAVEFAETEYHPLFHKLHAECVSFEQDMLLQSQVAISIFRHPVGRTAALEDYIAHFNELKSKHLLVRCASVIPCFKIYTDLGKLKCDLTADHPYYDWLCTYQDPAYVASTDELIETFANLTAGIEDAELKQEISATFAKCYELEHNFFDDCYHQRSTPVHCEESVAATLS